MPYGFSYVLSPDEGRFVQHLREIEFLRQRGHKVDYTRAEYAKRMGLREFTFDRCAKSLCRLGLVTKTDLSSRRRVDYRIDESAYKRLVQIVSVTRNIDKLIQFFDFHVSKLGKSIGEITDEDVAGMMQ